MRSLLYRQLLASLSSVASCEPAASKHHHTAGDNPDANCDYDKEAEAEAAAANKHATSFRKRRLTKAYHHREQAANGANANGDSGRTDEAMQDNSKAATPRPTAATTTREEGQRRQQRDTFLYAREMEGLDEYLRDRRHRHDSDRSRRYAGHEMMHPLPFPRDLVGTYSCHGMEPLLMRRFMSRLQIDGLDSLLVHHSPPIAKINQDRGGIAHPYGNDRNTALFAVFDGHGIHGEDVAQFAMYETISRLKSHPDFETDTPNALREVFLEMDEALRKSGIQSTYSGSTACCVLMRGDVLYVSNLGDSRAVLARRRRGMGGGRGSGSHEAIDLTRDQNPDLPGERDRIVRCGGHVSSPPGDGSGARVWLDPEHRKLGLAMSRSVGDHALKAVGVSAEPEVAVHRLDYADGGDDFIVIATDGVWEFMDSNEVVDLVAGCLEGGGARGGMGASEACELLIEVAASRWKDHEGDYRDDITAIVVRVKDLWGNNDERRAT